jgi:hypothetical protein
MLLSRSLFDFEMVLSVFPEARVRIESAARARYRELLVHQTGSSTLNLSEATQAELRAACSKAEVNEEKGDKGGKGRLANLLQRYGLSRNSNVANMDSEKKRRSVDLDPAAGGQPSAGGQLAAGSQPTEGSPQPQIADAQTRRGSATENRPRRASFRRDSATPGTSAERRQSARGPLTIVASDGTHRLDASCAVPALITAETSTYATAPVGVPPSVSPVVAPMVAPSKLPVEPEGEEMCTHTGEAETTPSGGDGGGSGGGGGGGGGGAPGLWRAARVQKPPNQAKPSNEARTGLHRT